MLLCVVHTRSHIGRVTARWAKGKHGRQRQHNRACIWDTCQQKRGSWAQTKRRSHLAKHCYCCTSQLSRSCQCICAACCSGNTTATALLCVFAATSHASGWRHHIKTQVHTQNTGLLTSTPAHTHTHGTWNQIQGCPWGPPPLPRSHGPVEHVAMEKQCSAAAKPGPLCPLHCPKPQQGLLPCWVCSAVGAANSKKCWMAVMADTDISA